MATAIIANIFATTQPVSVSIKLMLTLNPNDDIIPMNLLGSKFADAITLRCLTNSFKLRVNQDAFSTSRNYATSVTINNCDMAEANLAFMNGFNAMASLYLNANINLKFSLATLPYPLPNLNYLNMYNSKGLNDMKYYPTPLTKGLVYLDLGSNDLDDEGANRLLEWITKSSFNTLQTLYADYNFLTQIPIQIPNFVALNTLEITRNQISSIGEGALRFNAPVLRLFAANNNISSIQPGAFQGKIFK